MSTTTQPPKPKRRWYQFSLKTLLLVMTVSTVAFGVWIQYRWQRDEGGIISRGSYVKRTWDLISLYNYLSHPGSIRWPCKAMFPNKRG